MWRARQVLCHSSGAGRLQHEGWEYMKRPRLSRRHRLLAVTAGVTLAAAIAVWGTVLASAGPPYIDLTSAGATVNSSAASPATSSLLAFLSSDAFNTTDSADYFWIS